MCADECGNAARYLGPAGDRRIVWPHRQRQLPLQSQLGCQTVLHSTIRAGPASAWRPKPTRLPLRPPLARRAGGHGHLETSVVSELLRTMSRASVSAGRKPVAANLCAGVEPPGVRRPTGAAHGQLFVRQRARRAARRRERRRHRLLVRHRLCNPCKPLQLRVAAASRLLPQ